MNRVTGRLMRKGKKGKVNKKALDAISKNYSKLKELCNYNKRGCYCSKSYEDIFQDTILFVVHDSGAVDLVTDEEIINHFLYRYKMVEFQTINDNKMLKEVKYADYIQAKETGTEED